MSRDVLVTGGLGFIGYHLCKQLIKNESDINITIVDNLSSTKLDYIDLVADTQIIIDDFRNFPETDIHFDEIYHLASPVGSVGILDRNGFIARDILDLAYKAASVAATTKAKLVYVSSSEVYGKDGSSSEDADQIVPNKRGTRMEYALGKLIAEHVLLNLASDSEFELRIVRPFNALGEWQSSHLGFVVPRFFEAAFAGHDLTVYGTGLQRRSFCHVQDLADGIIAVQQYGNSNTVYNVGNPHNITTIEALAKRIIPLCDSSSSICNIDPVSLYGKHYIEAFDKIPDITRVTSDTGWKPSIHLDEALERLYHHYYQKNTAHSKASEEKQYKDVGVTARVRKSIDLEYELASENR